MWRATVACRGQRMGNGHKAAHHRGAHTRLARQARARYNADPNTLCARCHQPARIGDPWQAGHKLDGIVATSLADYQPEHQSCNTSAGARLGNQRRAGNDPTLNW